MTATTTSVQLAHYGGRSERQPVKASEAIPLGAALGITTAGFTRNFNLGDRFAGFAAQQVTAAQWADILGTPADGDLLVDTLCGNDLIVHLTIAGVAQDDVNHQRPVYVLDNQTFGLTPGLGAKIGKIIGLDDSGKAIVLCSTAPSDGLGTGIKSLSAAATLTAEDLGKVILGDTQVAGFTITLPAAADCTGRGFTFVRTGTGTNALTIDGAGAETINGSANHAAMDAQRDTITIVSTGTEWQIIASVLA